MPNEFFRRTALIGFWPMTDFIVTVFANILLVNSGVVRAIIGTTVLASILNILFLHLLSFEKDLYGWMVKSTGTVGFVRLQKMSVKVGKTFAVLIAYLVSGPAMVGAPLIWILGIRGRKAYTLAIIGVILNAIVWVGGFYNLFWVLVKTALVREIPFFF